MPVVTRSQAKLSNLALTEPLSLEPKKRPFVSKPLPLPLIVDTTNGILPLFKRGLKPYSKDPSGKYYIVIRAYHCLYLKLTDLQKEKGRAYIDNLWAIAPEGYFWKIHFNPIKSKLSLLPKYWYDLCPIPK
jgi:hypothetical protein